MNSDVSQDLRRGAVILIVFDKENQGPIVLYEEMRQYGVPCKFVYYLSDDEANRASLTSLIRSSGAILIGLSFASNSAKSAFALADYLSREDLRIPIIFGGVHPTIDPVSCLDFCNAACVGEGDEVLMEIVKKIVEGQDYLTSHNLVYKKGGKVVQNPIYPLVSDLDKLPLRRLYTDDHFLIDGGQAININKDNFFTLMPHRKYDYMQIFSRGCPYSCSFCCNSKFRKIYPDWSRVRSKSVTAVIDEVCANLKLNPHVITVFPIDDCFLVHDVGWLEDFVRQWREKVNKPIRLFSIPEFINSEKLRVLKKIDVCYINLGLQSGSKRIQAMYNRRFSRDSFLQACNLIHSMGYHLCVDIILDNPWENEEDMFETLDVLTQIKKPFLMQQYSLRIYPSTKLYDDYMAENKELPLVNRLYEDAHFVTNTIVNHILVLTQFLPKAVVMSLFKNRQRSGAKAAVGALYFICCAFFLPFLGLYIVAPKGAKQKIALAVSYRSIGIAWIKGLLGLNKISMRKA